MNRKQALSIYLLGTFSQLLLVSLLVWFLRAGRMKVDFTSTIGIIAISSRSTNQLFYLIGFIS